MRDQPPSPIPVAPPPIHPHTHVHLQCYFLGLLPHSVYVHLAEKRMQKARLKLLKRRAMASKQQ